MLIFAVATSALCVVQYSLTGSILALIICFIGIFRNLTALAAIKWPIFHSWMFLVFFLLMNTGAFFVTAKWDAFNAIDTLPLIGSYLGTVAIFFSKMTITKSFMIACGATWLFYEYHAGIYGQMVGETFTLVANVVALATLMSASRRGVAEQDVDNVDTQIIEVITSSIPVITEKVRTATIPVMTVATASIPVYKNEK